MRWRRFLSCVLLSLCLAAAGTIAERASAEPGTPGSPAERRSKMASPPAAASAIVNSAPRRDVQGEIVNAHDGCLEQFGKRFYLYGTAYGTFPELYAKKPGAQPLQGATFSQQLVCYISTNLVDWVRHGPLLKSEPGGFCVRPYVKYNARTRKYVLWFNWSLKGQGGDGRFVTATADRPEGPYVIGNRNVRVAHSPLKMGDLGLFVDDDGTGYLIYVRIDPQAEPGKRHRVSIDRLTPDYLGSTLQNSGILRDEAYEAPAMFKRGKLYYALFDGLCGYCAKGSGAMVFTATSPLGPYTYRNNINRDESGAPIIAAQQTHVATVELGAGVKYLWMGDRWRSDPFFGHSFQYWSSPLRFTEDGSIQSLKWEDQWPLEKLKESVP